MMTATTERTAFVLAGGGSFGSIQVGMLRALVAHGVKADLVVGTSVGAINGAYFAGDPTATGVARLEALWRKLRRRDVFPLSLPRIGAFFSRSPALGDASGLRHIIESELPYRQLESAAIPIHICATELLSGGSVCLSSGPAADAILASSAVPAVFPPVSINGITLIDGAIASNTPITMAIELGATRLIVLPTGFACALQSPPTSTIASALHALNLLIAHQMVRDLAHIAGRVNVVTVPPLCPLAVSPYDFSRANELIERAAKTTTVWLESGGLDEHGIPHALLPHD